MLPFRSKSRILSKAFLLHLPGVGYRGKEARKERHRLEYGAVPGHGFIARPYQSCSKRGLGYQRHYHQEQALAAMCARPAEARDSPHPWPIPRTKGPNRREQQQENAPMGRCFIYLCLLQAASAA